MFLRARFFCKYASLLLLEQSLFQTKLRFYYEKATDAAAYY